MLKIGKIDLKFRAIPAPLAGLTDIAFRKLLDEIGYVDYMVTEMISVEGLRRQQRKTLDMIRPGDFRTPQFIQLFGSEPAAFVDAVKYIENETLFVGIDINMGCPAPKVIRKGGGAALLKEPDRIAAIIKETRKNTTLPLTVKIRLGYNHVNVQEIAAILEAEGVDAVVVHFRLRSDGYAGQAKWDFVPVIREELKRTIFIGNGDIKSVSDARDKLAQVDAVMIGRGSVINPLIFAEMAGTPLPPPLSLHWAAQRLAQLIEEYYPVKMQLPHLKAYARYLFSNRMYSKKSRKQIYDAKTFREATDYFTFAFDNDPVTECPLV